MPRSGASDLGKRRQEFRGSVSHLAGCGVWWVAGACFCFGFGFGVRGWACVCVSVWRWRGWWLLEIGKINAPAKFLPALAQGECSRSGPTAAPYT